MISVLKFAVVWIGFVVCLYFAVTFLLWVYRNFITLGSITEPQEHLLKEGDWLEQNRLADSTGLDVRFVTLLQAIYNIQRSR